MTTEVGEIILGEQRVIVTVARSARRRRTMAFRMESSSALKVTVPIRASMTSVRFLIQKHMGWVRRRLEDFQKISPQRLVVKQDYKDGSCFSYLGHGYKLQITQDKNQSQGCKLLPHRLMVNVHVSHDVKDLREEVRLEILLWLKRRAKIVFQKRVEFWSSILGVRCRRLNITNAGRRWGSCSSKNDIRLSWRLIMAPLPILDYVVVHELCHVRHKNHGPYFWKQVGSVMPDYKARRKRLHFIGRGLVLD